MGFANITPQIGAVIANPINPSNITPSQVTPMQITRRSARLPGDNEDTANASLQQMHQCL
jgi:hypothetical protein